MTLSLAGVASAQSNTGSNTGSNTSTNTGGTTTGTSASSAIGGTTARTGAELWIPLALGGLVITVAFATRAGLARAASRIP
jgi:hypothetical protein